jgi:hypothetical protein
VVGTGHGGLLTIGRRPPAHSASARYVEDSANMSEHLKP